MTEPISLTALFGASKGVLDVSIKIAKALELIESLESKLALLTQVDFNAAWKTLLQACNSSSSDEQQSILLNDARKSFTKATCFEKGERLFYAYLGLAICHFLLNDINNVESALIEATKISIYKDIYQKTMDLSFGLNKYSMSSFISIYHPMNWLNVIRYVPEIPSVLVQKKEIKKYNKSKSDSIYDIYKKINAEEKMIIIVTKVNQPSSAFKNLELTSLNLINLQKECLEIITNL
jgi:hypothetical protein